ncbi:MAG TPA: elongation factor 1-beta [Nitrososphaeraceae archaeon]|jgi:elongation factor 1-beta|nr:elongation factor 1-beta [Nitrososphaeraceae archaeon]
MASRVVARIRILPAEADSNLDNIIIGLKNKIPKGMELKAHAKEPIAFGLQAIIGDFLIDDEEGQIDKLEDSIKKTEGVGEIEIINVSRQFVKMT